MNILGIIVIFLLPYFAGYILKTILNKRETSQIETYLTGFFFVFLLQGVALALGYLVFDLELGGLSNVVIILFIAVGVGFGITLIYNLIKIIRAGKHNNKYHAKLSRMDVAILSIATIVAVLIAIRIVLLEDYLRTDFILPIVRTTLATGEINTYNPITSQPYTLGLITSKKIITLPIYYACLCNIFGIDEGVLLYVILTIQTVMCAYGSCILFIEPVLRNRRNTYIFCLFLGVMILSGDYFSGAIGAKLLWYGYSGETIVGAVMLPYILFVLTKWYRQRREYGEDMSIHNRIICACKLLLCLTSAFFITSVSMGVLPVVIEIVLFGLCCILRFRIEEVKKS